MLRAVIFDIDGRWWIRWSCMRGLQELFSRLLKNPVL